MMSEVMTKRRRKRETASVRRSVELSMKRAGGERMVEYQTGKRRSPMAKRWWKGEGRDEPLAFCLFTFYLPYIS